MPEATEALTHDIIGAAIEVHRHAHPMIGIDVFAARDDRRVQVVAERDCDRVAGRQDERRIERDAGAAAVGLPRERCTSDDAYT